MDRSAALASDLPGGWKTLDPTPLEASFYGEAVRVLTPATCDELQDVIRFAEEQKLPLIPAGLGTHAYLGNPPASEGLVVSMREFHRVLRYEPGDFTVGVEAGVRLTELRETLRQNNQEVIVDFPLKAHGTMDAAEFEVGDQLLAVVQGKSGLASDGNEVRVFFFQLAQESCNLILEGPSF